MTRSGQRDTAIDASLAPLPDRDGTASPLVRQSFAGTAWNRKGAPFWWVALIDI
jgi:hypothetical protein